jgi:hypothetical protein
MGRNLKNKKKLTLVRMMNRTGLNNKNIVISVNFNDSDIINRNSRELCWDEQYSWDEQ